MRSTIYHLRVEFGDCDPFNIVHYPNFYRWFDAATQQLFVEASLTREHLRKEFGVVGMPVLETGARYQSPGRFGDRLAIECSLVEFGRKSIRLRHVVKHGADLLVDGFEVRALVEPHPDDPQRIRAMELTEAIRRTLA